MSHHDARADDDGLLVADDHARVLRGEVGARAVGPDDRVAREYPAPAVIAGDIVARPRAVLGRREACAEKRDGGGERNGSFCVNVMISPAGSSEAQISSRSGAALGSPRREIRRADRRHSLMNMP